MPFYGPQDTQILSTLSEHIDAVQRIYSSRGLSFFGGDNMVAALRNMHFLVDASFVEAFRANAVETADLFKLWRLHVYCWACHSALAVDGDFVECGVYKGLYSATMAQYLSFEKVPKRLFLYDTFAGLSEAYSTENERATTNKFYQTDGLYDAVVERFAKYPNVRVIKGVVPDIFVEVSPERIAFLHLDMNAAAAETAALDALFERVAPGGIVLMDDFGRNEQVGLFKALLEWMLARDYRALEMPTGQGMVVKR